jgi:hypothetical protein
MPCTPVQLHARRVVQLPSRRRPSVLGLHPPQCPLPSPPLPLPSPPSPPPLPRLNPPPCTWQRSRRFRAARDMAEAKAAARAAGEVVNEDEVGQG